MRNNTILLFNCRTGSLENVTFFDTLTAVQAEKKFSDFFKSDINMSEIQEIIRKGPVQLLWEKIRGDEKKFFKNNGNFFIPLHSGRDFIIFKTPRGILKFKYEGEGIYLVMRADVDERDFCEIARIKFYAHPQRKLMPAGALYSLWMAQERISFLMYHNSPFEQDFDRELD